MIGWCKWCANQKHLYPLKLLMLIQLFAEILTSPLYPKSPTKKMIPFDQVRKCFFIRHDLLCYIHILSVSSPAALGTTFSRVTCFCLQFQFLLEG